MPSRTCPQNAHQSGVCGCPSFWKTLAPNPVVIDLTPEDADREGEDFRFDMYTVDRLFGPDSHHGSIRDALTLRGTPGKNNEGMSRRVYKRRVARGKGKGELNGKVKKLRVLVDYELPEGEERLEWDTDEVRLMAGEIE